MSCLVPTAKGSDASSVGGACGRVAFPRAYWRPILVTALGDACAEADAGGCVTQSEISEELVEAYRATAFRCDDDRDAFVLSVGVRSCAAYVAAFNPGTRRRAPK